MEQQTHAQADLEQQLDEVLGLINKELATTDTKEVIKKEDLTSFETIATKVLDRLNNVDDTAKIIHELFYHDLALGKDHSESSKIALLEALKVRMESPKTLVELAKALAKLQSAATKSQVGIQINTQNGEQVGINLEALKEEC